MTKDLEKEIEELYEFLGITKTDEEKNSEKAIKNNERTFDFFEKRWDSSFFANSTRY